jgi:hypothetical protein
MKLYGDLLVVLLIEMMRHMRLHKKREFYEETGGNARIGELTYICSQQVHDWRYKGTEHGIMTTLFLARFGFGNAVISEAAHENAQKTPTTFLSR